MTSSAKFDALVPREFINTFIKTFLNNAKDRAWYKIAVSQTDVGRPAPEGVSVPLSHRIMIHHPGKGGRDSWAQASSCTTGDYSP